MNISEIVVYPSRDEPIEKFVGHFHSEPMASAFNGLHYSEHSDSADHYLGLFDCDSLVSVVHLSVRRTGLFQITYSQTEPKFRRQGCFRFLLLKALDSHQAILSDDHQTSESVDAWKALIQYPSRFEIGIYDLETKKITPTLNVDPQTIWNQETNPVLIITRQQMSPGLQEHNYRDDEFKKRHGRNFDNIWFGPSSSTDSYDNP